YCGMVSSRFYRALAFLRQGIVFSMEYCCCEATASALHPDGLLLSSYKILSVYFFILFVVFFSITQLLPI
ncbi:hypothetical protein M8369_13095, partial [Klebsiella pneumoniae]|nr:hypothetical protein [Klebsiella pneumoniae]